MLIAHAPLAILANRVINKKYYNKDNQLLLDILAGIFGILPDFDFFYLVAINKPVYSHHLLITHTPIFWIIFTLLLAIALKQLSRHSKTKVDNKYITSIVLTLLIGVFSHLISDLLTGHIMILYPFTNHAYTLLGTFLPDNPFSNYIHPVFALEISIILVCLLIMAHHYLKVASKISKTVIIATTTLVTVLMASVIYVYSITYHKDYRPKMSNGMINMDIDNDNITDPFDSDTNNDGIDNLKEMSGNKTEIVGSMKDIITSGKLASDSKLNYKMGGVDSARLLIQATSQSNLYITPIIDAYSKKEGVNLSSQNYLQQLFDYSLKYGLIAKLGNLSQLNRDDIFFIVNENHVQNVGAITSKGEVLIVLSNDTWLTPHTIEDIKITDNQIIYIFK